MAESPPPFAPPPLLRPQSLLFACSENTVRSAMAEALTRQMLGRSIYVDSAGVRAGGVNPFTTEVLLELGIDRSRHRPKTFDELEETSFDAIVTLSPEAHHRALEFVRNMAVEVRYWPTIDPSAIEGSRAAVLDAFRSVRDGLAARLRATFEVATVPTELHR